MDILSRIACTRAHLYVLLLATAALCACGKPTMLMGLDVSPNSANGLQADGGAQTAGVTPILVGDADALYAVSMDAGVWQSLNGGAWTQLANSPQRAYSIAIDRSDRQHIAVGERDGDRSDPAQNQSGIYESFDGGKTFGDYFDPRSLGGCKSSQAIPALAFSPNSALIAATACGVAVKPKGQAWAFPATAIGANLVTAVTASLSK